MIVVAIPINETSEVTKDVVILLTGCFLFLYLLKHTLIRIRLLALLVFAGILGRNLGSRLLNRLVSLNLLRDKVQSFFLRGE